jgi:anti-anti-sigma factor
MEIQEQRHGAVAVLKPRGPLCAQDAEQFKTRAESVRESSLGRLVIDASDIAYLDSKGIEALLDTSEVLMDSGRLLRLCGANDTVREILDLTGVSGQFEYFQDVGSAVRSFL